LLETEIFNKNFRNVSTAIRNSEGSFKLRYQSINQSFICS